MKAQPFFHYLGTYKPCAADEANCLHVRTPGPFTDRFLPLVSEGGKEPMWKWNGDTEKPTLHPSVLTKTEDAVCHIWIRDGMVQFLGDCTHAFRNKTVPLLDIES
jgi:hypothetical protein